MRTGNCQLWKYYALAIGSPQGRGRESAACSRLATPYLPCGLVACEIVVKSKIILNCWKNRL